MHPFRLLRFNFKCFWKRKKKKTLEIGAVHLAMNSTPSVSFHRKYVRLSGVINFKKDASIKNLHLFSYSYSLLSLRFNIRNAYINGKIFILAGEICEAVIFSCDLFDSLNAVAVENLIKL